MNDFDEFDEYPEETIDERTKQRFVTTKTGKKVPAHIFNLNRNRKKSNQQFILLSKISMVFEKHGWVMDDATFTKVVDEVIRLYTKEGKTRREVEDLVAICYGQKFAGGDITTRKALTSELLQHVRDGLMLSLETNRLQLHQGYLDRYLRILFPSLHLKGKMSEEEMASFKLVSDGNTKSIEAKNVPLSELLDTMKQMEVKRIEQGTKTTDQG